MAQAASPHRTRFLVASQAELVTLGLQRLIGAMPGAEVIATARDMDALHAELRACTPDVLIVDTAFAASLEAAATSCAVPRILLIGPKPHPGRAGARFAACGYICERDDLDRICVALEKAAHCEASCTDPPCGHACALWPPRPALPLTTREREVFDLIGRGLGSNAIAGALTLSVKTVETHRENIKRKLGLANAGELIHAAHRWAAGERP